MPEHSDGEMRLGEHTQRVVAARDEVRRHFGAALAEKVSDRYAMRVHSLVRPTGVETMGFAETSRAGAIVELGTGGATAGAAGSPSPVPGPRTLTPASEIAFEATLAEEGRHRAIQRVREDVSRMAAPICAHLERAAPGVTAAAPEALVMGAGTEVCWLNGTIRAPSNPALLAEIAADPFVSRIGAPRRLVADQASIGTILGAVAFSQATGHRGATVAVAVLDSEIAIGHPAFGQRVVQMANFTLEPWGYPGEHGTAVAGFIGANAGGLTGIAPEVILYGYKVLAANPVLNADDFGGALALQRAVEDGAAVVNLSWGTGFAGLVKSREARACDVAWALGVVVIKSAGNRGPWAQTLTSPAEADGIIVVGATDATGSWVPGYSSRGPLPDGTPRPHLVAPGGSPGHGLIGAHPDGGAGDVGFGTSYAAPQVAGLAALLLDDAPWLTPDQVRTRLVDEASPLPGVDSATQGRGLAQLGAVHALATPVLASAGVP